LEEIAAENIRRIKALQPEGPYYLTGACFGGLVVYEMARQLVGAGERLGLLILLDPAPPFTDGDGRRRGKGAVRSRLGKPFGVPMFMLNRVALHVRNLARLRGAERRAYLREKSRMAGEMIRQRDPFRGDRSELVQVAVHAANRRAARAYIPGPFSGPTILCFTRDRPSRGARNFREDWLELVSQSGGPVYAAGRDSGDMLNLPHVYELADHVNRWLDSAGGVDSLEERSRAASRAAREHAPGKSSAATLEPAAR
jgi:thioesterase domain-containing protein